jgi:NAD(P)-dependent dehydrogenase (short-subunit alcohol dehydrogenase family)
MNPATDSLRRDSAPAYVVVGATGGIGSALCRRLAADGARLAIVARGDERLRRLAEETGALPLTADARDRGALESAVAGAVERFGRVDGAANLAGSVLLKPAHLTTDEEWETTLAVNLTTAFNLLRAAAKAMRKGGGSVVLMSSAAARTGLANHEAIAAAKAGVEGLARSAAATYAGQGLRVNCVAPGLVATPLTERITANPAARTASEAMHALGRIGEPEEVASAIAWLLAPEQGWVTGQVLGVDGGLAALQPRPRR